MKCLHMYSLFSACFVSHRIITMSITLAADIRYQLSKHFIYLPALCINHIPTTCFPSWIMFDFSRILAVLNFSSSFLHNFTGQFLIFSSLPNSHQKALNSAMVCIAFSFESDTCSTTTTTKESILHLTV